MNDVSPALRKRAMRALWRRLPRTGLSYKLAKGLTRTLLRPESRPQELDVALTGGFTMRVDLADIVGNDLFCMDDHYEALSMRLWRDLARTAATVVDFGSHGGLFACAAAAVNPRARVIAVEAFAPNAALLRVNARQFGNLEAIEAAIGVSGGRRRFRLSAITGGGFVEEGDAGGTTPPGIRGQSRDSFEIDTVTLADFCAQHRIQRIDLMKLDLEGLEHPILTGQDEFWTRHAPAHVLVEIARRSTGAGRDDVFHAMTARGYRHRRVERLYTIPWLRADELANWYFWKPAPAR